MPQGYTLIGVVVEVVVDEVKLIIKVVAV